MTAQAYSPKVNQSHLTTQNTQIIKEYSIDEISHFYGGASFTNEFLIDGNYAYIANGYDGLSIVDISNQLDLVPVSSIQTGYHAFHVEKYGDLVLIENGETIIGSHHGGGVSVFNVSDPYSPILVYEDHAISASSFKIYDNYLLVGSFSNQIDIYDIQSGQLVFQSNFNVIYFAISMTIVGNYVYTTENIRNSSVYDLSNISQVSRVYQFNESYSTMVPVGDVLYAWGNNGTNIFSIFNITNPGSPQLIETQSIINVPQIAKVGNIIHAIEPNQGYFTINVTDPFNPIYTTKQASLQSGEIEMVGDIGLVIQSTSLTSYNMSNPTNLVTLDSVSYSRLKFDYIYQFGEYNLATAGENLFIFDNYGNLLNQITSVDLGIGSVSMYAMISVGNIVYIKGSHPTGIIIIDMTDVLNPIYLGVRNFSGLEGGFDVIGSTLFFGNNYGLYSFNITDPTDPVQIQYLNLIGTSIEDIFAVGNQIVIESGTFNNHIFDVTDPNNMTILSSLGDRATDLYVVNDIFMIAVSDAFEIYQYNEGQPPTFLRAIVFNNIGEVEPIGDLILNNWGNNFNLLNFSLIDTAIDVVSTFSIATQFGEIQDYSVRNNLITIATEYDGIYTYELIETIREIITETETITETFPVTSTQIEEVTVTLTQDPDQTVTDTVTFTEASTTITHTVTVTEGNNDETTDEPTKVSRANVQNLFPFAIVVMLIIQNKRKSK